MDDGWLGVVVEQSLEDPAVLRGVDVVGRKRLGAWDFALVSVSPVLVERWIESLRAAMVGDDAWYAHLFHGQELIVVFRDAVFGLTTDPASWAPAVEHGLAGGIPRGQLEFHPRTRAAAAAFFGLR